MKNEPGTMVGNTHYDEVRSLEGRVRNYVGRE
jgi:hypothetical protein